MREIFRITRSRKTDWDSYNSNNMTYLENKLVIDTCNVTCPVKAVTSSKDLPWWNINLDRIRTKVQKLFKPAKKLEIGQDTKYTNNVIREAKLSNWKFYKGIE